MSQAHSFKIWRANVSIFCVVWVPLQCFGFRLLLLLLLLLLAIATWLCGRRDRHNSPPASSVMDFVFRRSDGSHVSIDTVHPSLLRSSSFSSPRWYHLQNLSSDVFLVSPLYVVKPPQSCSPDTSLLCSLLSVSPCCHRFLHGLLVCGHMPICKFHFCHFQFLHVGASHCHCLHPVQHSWLNDHFVYLSFNMWWYSRIS